MNVMQSVN